MQQRFDRCMSWMWKWRKRWNSANSWEKTFANVINCNRLAYEDDPDNSQGWKKWEKERIIPKKIVDQTKRKKKEKKTANSPEQDLHPDWDRFRGTMLYPLSCGELAMNGE